MKKTMAILLVLLVSVFAVKAQLTQSKWKGAIKGDAAQDVTLAFGKDTLVVYATDKSTIETMTYKATSNTFTVMKVSGQSDCDTNTVGNYKFVIHEGTMYVSLDSDACGDRSSALDKTQWKKSPSTPKGGL